MGYGVADGALLSPWGPIRTRYDFDVKQAKFDYTRVINSTTIFEFSLRDVHELGRRARLKTTRNCRKSSARTIPDCSVLPQFAPQNNPLGVIPKATFGTLQSSANLAARRHAVGRLRQPVSAHRRRFGVEQFVQPDAHARPPHLQGGAHARGRVLRPGAREHLRRPFNFANDGDRPRHHGLRVCQCGAGPCEGLHRVARKTARRSASADVGVVRPGYLEDSSARSRWTSASACTGGRRRCRRVEKLPGSASSASIQRGAAIDRCSSAGSGQWCSAVRRIRVTGEILPPTYIGLIVAGTGYTCARDHAAEPCQINGIVTQNDPTFIEGGGGGSTSRCRFSSIRASGWRGPSIQNGDSCRRRLLPRWHRWRDVQGRSGVPVQQGDSVHGLEQLVPGHESSQRRWSRTSPASSEQTPGGRTTSDSPRPFSANSAPKSSLDAAYVGTRGKYLSENWNYNMLPAGARFLPQNRDTTVAATPLNPGAMPDAFLRPIRGFNDISIAQPTGNSQYRLDTSAAHASFYRRVRDGGQLYMGARVSAHPASRESTALDIRSDRHPGACARHELHV